MDDHCVAQATVPTRFGTTPNKSGFVSRKINAIQRVKHDPNAQCVALRTAIDSHATWMIMAYLKPPCPAIRNRFACRMDDHCVTLTIAPTTIGTTPKQSGVGCMALRPFRCSMQYTSSTRRAQHATTGIEQRQCRQGYALNNRNF